MKIIFNGEPREGKSKRLGDLIKELDGVYKQGCIVAVISEKKGGELKNEFSLETAKGEARIKIAREKETEAVPLFHKVYKKIHNDSRSIAGKG